MLTSKKPRSRSEDTRSIAALPKLKSIIRMATSSQIVKPQQPVFLLADPIRLQQLKKQLASSRNLPDLS